MILQALTELFEDLVQQGKLSAPGWSNAKISYALCLDECGALVAVMPTQHEETVGKKTLLRPNLISLPSTVTRTVGILPNFLWDNSSNVWSPASWTRRWPFTPPSRVWPVRNPAARP